MWSVVFHWLCQPPTRMLWKRPFHIGQSGILHPLIERCFCYVCTSAVEKVRRCHAALVNAGSLRRERECERASNENFIYWRGISVKCGSTLEEKWKRLSFYCWFPMWFIPRSLKKSCNSCFLLSFNILAVGTCASLCARSSPSDRCPAWCLSSLLSLLVLLVTALLSGTFSLPPPSLSDPLPVLITGVEVEVVYELRLWVRLCVRLCGATLAGSSTSARSSTSLRCMLMLYSSITLHLHFPYRWFLICYPSHNLLS